MTNLLRNAISAVVVLGMAVAVSAPNPLLSGAMQVRPDLDENDVWRNKNFDMDGALDLLDIRPGMTVGDVGAGWGYMTFKLAGRVAPGGIVVAEDIEQRWIDVLKARAAERGLNNIETILGTETDPRFPEGRLDMIFMHAVLQWIEDRASFLRTAGAGLKPDGRFVIIEPETEGDDPEFGVTGPGRFPTRAGYLEIFRRAGFEAVQVVDKTPGRRSPVFVLKKKAFPSPAEP